MVRGFSEFSSKVRGLSWREMRNAGLKGCDKEIRRVIGGLVDRGLVLSEKSGRVTKYRLA